MLRHPHGSVPVNPLLAEPLYLAKYIERMGTGTGDMIRRCHEAGLQDVGFSISDGFTTTIYRKARQVTDQVTDQVTGEVAGEVAGEVTKLVTVCHNSMTRKTLQLALSLKGEANFRDLYLTPALEAGYIEMTIPEKPNSRLQKYRLTDKGMTLLAALRKGSINQ